MPEVRLIDANALKAKLKIGANAATYSQLKPSRSSAGE